MKVGGGYSSQDTSSAFQNNGTANTTANKLPTQLATAPDIFATLHNYLQNPQAAVNPARMAARSQVNQNYSGLPDRVRQKFLTTGGGGSGKSGQAILAGETGRAGALANVDQEAQQQAAELPLTATQLAEAFLGINMGQNTTTTGSGTSSSSQSGFSIGGSAGYSAGSGASGPWSQWGG